MLLPFFTSMEISVPNRLNYIFGQSFKNEFTEFLKVHNYLGANETIIFFELRGSFEHFMDIVFIKIRFACNQNITDVKM